MKYLVISDIHGSYKYLNLVLSKFESLGCDKILILGDILYHGPRNDLPEEYQPKKCIELLNSHKDKIIAIRGNCDAEVDEMVLEFPLVSSYTLELNSIRIWLSHGHHLEKKPKDIKVVLHPYSFKWWI